MDRLTHRLNRLWNRVLLPVGVSALVLGAIGDGLLGTVVLFRIGLVVAAAVWVVMATGIHIEGRRPERSDVTDVSLVSERGNMP